MQDIYVWIEYLSRTNPSQRSFFLRFSLLMLSLVNTSYTLLLNYWVLSSFYYVWLICLHIYSSQALLCTLMSLQEFVSFSCFHNHQAKPPTILFCLHNIIWSLTPLYLWYSFLWREKLESLRFQSLDQVRNMHNYLRFFLNPLHSGKIAFLNLKVI